MHYLKRKIEYYVAVIHRQWVSAGKEGIVKACGVLQKKKLKLDIYLKLTTSNDM